MAKKSSVAFDSLNTGIEIPTTSLGSITVRQFSLRSIALIAARAMRMGDDLFNIFSPESKESKQDHLAFLAGLLESEAGSKLLQYIISKACNLSEDQVDVDTIPAPDAAEILAAMMQVNDWEKLKKSFFQILSLLKQ
jgi:hypothetical protein